VPLLVAVLGLAWLAVAAQLAALTVDRYAAYPGPSERPAEGPLRRIVRQVRGAGRGRRTADAERDAL
jgi:hypothetical protein